MVLFTGRCWSRWLVRAVLTIALGLATSTAAYPQPTSTDDGQQVGFTGGLSVDPEQAFGGVFWRSPEIAGRFHLRPGLEGGVGDDLRLATINIDFLVRFPLGASGWDFVQGGGPAVVVTRFETGRNSETDISAGGSYIIGFAHESGFLGEFRIGGGGRTPSLKFTAGWALTF